MRRKWTRAPSQKAERIPSEKLLGVLRFPGDERPRLKTGAFCFAQSDANLTSGLGSVVPARRFLIAARSAGEVFLVSSSGEPRLRDGAPRARWLPSKEYEDEYCRAGYDQDKATRS